MPLPTTISSTPRGICAGRSTVTASSIRETGELLTRWLLLLKEQGEDAAFLQIRQELKGAAESVNTGQKPLSIHCVGGVFFLFGVFHRLLHNLYRILHNSRVGNPVKKMAASGVVEVCAP